MDTENDNNGMTVKKRKTSNVICSILNNFIPSLRQSYEISSFVVKFPSLDFLYRKDP